MLEGRSWEVLIAMRFEHLSLLRGPHTQSELRLEPELIDNGRVKQGTLIDRESGERFPVVGFIPRFVGPENYAGSFGYQWNRHRRTQLDAETGFSMSLRRFQE